MIEMAGVLIRRTSSIEAQSRLPDHRNRRTTVKEAL